MEKTCVTIQPDLPEIEPSKTCTCESETELLRIEMSELQERVHKIENLLVEKDQIITKMVANYDFLVQRLDFFQGLSLVEQRNNIDTLNSESELAEANDEHSANLKHIIQLEEGNGELDHTILLNTKEKRNNKDMIKGGPELRKRKIKPKLNTKKQATDCSVSKLEEKVVCGTDMCDIEQNKTDTNILTKELSGNRICLQKKSDITKKMNKGLVLSNINFLATMSKEKEKSACQPRKNKNATDCRIRPKDETQDSKDETRTTRLNLISEEHYLQTGEIESTPKGNSNMLTDDQRLQTTTGQSKCLNIQSNGDHIEHSEDVKDEISLSWCKQPSDDKQAEKTGEPVASYDELVSHDITFDKRLKDKIGFDFTSLETSYAFIKTDDEKSAKGITARENTCGTVSENWMNIQKESVCHSLNGSQHVDMNNPNNDTCSLGDEIEKETDSKLFDKLRIEDDQIPYDELSKSVSNGMSLTQEFIIQNDDENESSDCKSTDFRIVLDEADTETSPAHHFETEEINNTAENIQYQSQSLDKEQSCKESSDKAVNDFDLDPHQNNEDERSNWNETNCNDEQLLTRNIDIENNVNGSDNKQDQEMVYDIYTGQTKGCLENSIGVSDKTNINTGDSNNCVETGDESTSTIPIAEQLISHENDLICSKPKTKCPDSYTRAEKETGRVLIEPIQEKTKISSYDSELFKNGSKVEGGPKVWKALADVEQKAARKTLQELRGAHNVICIDTSVGETASKRINTFVSEFLNGLVEMSEHRDLETEHVALVTFGHETKVQIRFTSEYHRILKCLENLTFGGPSQIFGGLMMAFAAAHSSRYTHVINEDTPSIYTKIIMLTDGRPYSLPDMADTSEMDETKAMILQEMETIRKNCHDLFVIPIGDADIDFLNQMVSIAEGTILDFTSGRQLSRRQFLSMNIKGPVDLKNNLVDDLDGMFTQDDQEDMIDIVEKSKRHIHTRQESRNRRYGGRRNYRNDGNDRFVETRERNHGGRSSDSKSFVIPDIAQVLPGLNSMFESGSSFPASEDADRIPMVFQCCGQSEGVRAVTFCSERSSSDISKYFESLCTEGYVLDTSAKEKQPAAKQKKSSEKHQKNKNSGINFP